MLLLTISIGLIIGYITSLSIQTYPIRSKLMELKSLYISNIKEKRRDYLLPLVNTLIYVIVFYNSANYLEQIYLSLLSTVFILIAYIDIKEMVIPDRFIIISIILTIAYKGLDYIIYNQSIELANSIIGMLLPIIIFSTLFFISKNGMGEGDILLVGLIGFILGKELIMVAVVLAFLIFTIVAAAIYYRSNKDINKEIPFAPFLIFAYYLTLLYGDQILNILG